MTNFKGSKYEETKDLNLKEIAKLVRADIKEYCDNQKKLGVTIKITVATQYYSMGQSLNFTIQECNQPLYNENWNEDNIGSEDNYYHSPYYYTLKDIIEYIYNQYNYDNSEPQTDYFDSRFHTHISIGERLSK